MRTPANIAGHPIHPMLVAIPIGLWLFSFACDLIGRFLNGTEVWSVVALYTMGGGIVGALLAAIPGLIDLLSLPAEPKKTALIHMSINLAIVALYIVNFLLRWADPTATGPMWLSALSVAMLAVSGWLGGKMVYIHGIAVSVGEPAPEPRPRSSASVHSAGE